MPTAAIIVVGLIILLAVVSMPVLMAVERLFLADANPVVVNVLPARDVRGPVPLETAQAVVDPAPAPTPFAVFQEPLAVGDVAQVYPATHVAGSYGNVPGDDCLWMGLQREGTHELFRQGPVDTDQDGAFYEEITLGRGGPTEYGERFRARLLHVPSALCDQWLAEKGQAYYRRYGYLAPVGVDQLRSLGISSLASLRVEIVAPRHERAATATPGPGTLK